SLDELRPRQEVEQVRALLPGPVDRQVGRHTEERQLARRDDFDVRHRRVPRVYGHFAVREDEGGGATERAQFVVFETSVTRAPRAECEMLVHRGDRQMGPAERHDDLVTRADRHEDRARHDWVALLLQVHEAVAGPELVDLRVAQLRAELAGVTVPLAAQPLSPETTAVVD